MNTQTQEPSHENSVVSYPSLELIQRLKSKIGSVKMLPTVAVRALEIAKDPNASIQEFAQVVQQDVKLAADVLSMANSVLYSATKPTANLAHAIARIGFRQCKNLIIASSLASVMKKMTLDEQWIRDVLWKHSVTTGVIATHLNRSLRTGFEGEEFTAGLIHDFGRTLLAVAFPAEFSGFDPLDFDESSDMLARESAAIGSNHCALGAWFANDQGLPEVLHDVICYHHKPHDSKKNIRLVALIAIADHMANHYQRFGESAAYDPAETPHLRFLEEDGVQGTTSRFQLVANDLCMKAVEDASELISL